MKSPGGFIPSHWLWKWGLGFIFPTNTCLPLIWTHAFYLLVCPCLRSVIVMKPRCIHLVYNSCISAYCRSNSNDSDQFLLLEILYNNLRIQVKTQNILYLWFRFDPFLLTIFLHSSSQPLHHIPVIILLSGMRKTDKALSYT